MGNSKKNTSKSNFNFTLTRLNGLNSEEIPYIVYDDDVKGLRCKVHPTGIKTLQVYKKPKGSHQAVTVKICRLGEKPLEEIRKAAREVINDMVNGINPNKQRKKQELKTKAESETLREVFEDYIDTDDLKESTKKFYSYQINKHLKDWLDLPLPELANAELLRKLQKEISKDGPTAANNSLRILRALFNYKYSLLEEMNADSDVLAKYTWPIKATKSRSKSIKFWNKETKRSNWISPADLPAWWKATELLSTDYLGEGDRARDYLQFVILTGMRRREVTGIPGRKCTGLKWENINFKTKMFIVYDTKNHPELELPLTTYLIEILERRGIQKSGRVFPFDEVKFFMAFVRGKSGVYFTIHDLRRSFISYAESLDIGAYSIKRLVNHRNKNDVTEGYTQHNIETLRASMQKITDYVLRASGSVKDNIIHLPQQNKA